MFPLIKWPTIRSSVVTFIRLTHSPRHTLCTYTSRGHLKCGHESFSVALCSTKQLYLPLIDFYASLVPILVVTNKPPMWSLSTDLDQEVTKRKRNVQSSFCHLVTDWAGVHVQRACTIVPHTTAVIFVSERTNKRHHHHPVYYSPKSMTIHRYSVMIFFFKNK